MGNATGKERYPTVVYDPDRSVNEQLEYFEPLLNTCKPFVFANLGLRVSVQAGFGTASEFLMSDGRKLTYPFLYDMLPEETSRILQGTRQRAHTEKELFPVARATHFEIAIMSESHWFTADQLDLRVSRGVKRCWTADQQVGRFVPKDGVEIILRRLHGAERYLTQQKTERQAVVSAQKQQLARIADLPSHIKSRIGSILQASFEEKEHALIEANVDKMSKGCGLSYALSTAEHMMYLQL